MECKVKQPQRRLPPALLPANQRGCPPPLLDKPTRITTRRPRACSMASSVAATMRQTPGAQLPERVPKRSSRASRASSGNGRPATVEATQCQPGSVGLEQAVATSMAGLHRHARVACSLCRPLRTRQTAQHQQHDALRRLCGCWQSVLLGTYSTTTCQPAAALAPNGRLCTQMARRPRCSPATLTSTVPATLNSLGASPSRPFGGGREKRARHTLHRKARSVDREAGERGSVWPRRSAARHPCSAAKLAAHHR